MGLDLPPDEQCVELDSGNSSDFENDIDDSRNVKQFDNYFDQNVIEIDDMNLQDFLSSSGGNNFELNKRIMTANHTDGKKRHMLQNN